MSRRREVREGTYACLESQDVTARQDKALILANQQKVDCISAVGSFVLVIVSEKN
jgi:hypothetical protein